MILHISIVIFILFVLVVVNLYNKIVRKRNQIENAISSTDALFIKRSDLIPNLIATVQKYMAFESDTLKKIISLRGMNGATNPDLELTAKKALDKLMVQIEDYPELKANTQFRDLQYSINEVEEQISAGRRYISASITDYNNSIFVFPSNIIAKLFGFKTYEWQYASKIQKENVKVKDIFDN